MEAEASQRRPKPKEAQNGARKWAQKRAQKRPTEVDPSGGPKGGGPKGGEPTCAPHLMRRLVDHLATDLEDDLALRDGHGAAKPPPRLPPRARSQRGRLARKGLQPRRRHVDNPSLGAAVERHALASGVGDEAGGACRQILIADCLTGPGAQQAARGGRRGAGERSGNQFARLVTRLELPCHLCCLEEAQASASLGEGPERGGNSRRAMARGVEPLAQPEALALGCCRHDQDACVQLTRSELREQRNEYGAVALLPVRPRGSDNGQLEDGSGGVHLRDCSGDCMPAAIEHHPATLGELLRQIDRRLVDLYSAKNTLRLAAAALGTADGVCVLGRPRNLSIGAKECIEGRGLGGLT